MKRLNRQAALLIRQVEVHACTDITGFALLGHGYEMAERSRARLRFYLDRLPFVDGAIQYAERWLFPGGTCRNEQAYEHGVDFGPGVSEEMQQLLYTPETSGGLLVAIPEGAVATLTSAFAAVGHDLWVIGEVVAGMGIEIVG
jgi:selenide,water dikinase